MIPNMMLLLLEDDGLAFGVSGAATADDAWYPPIKMLDRQGIVQLNRDRTNTIERHGIGTLERH